MSEIPLKRKIFLLEIADTIIEIVVMLIVFIAIQYFVVSPFVVSGMSMETNLHDQEIILVNRLGHSKYIFRGQENIKRGDVVVFRPPIDTDEYYIKRVIGLPGDTVRFENNHVFVNDQQLNEPYANCDSNENLATFPQAWASPCTYDDVNTKSFVVPDSHYFVMGDNRQRSSDSRTCFTAMNATTCPQNAASHFVPYDNIVGQASFVLWPFNSQASRTNSGNFFGKIWPLDNIHTIDSHDATKGT